MKILIVKLGALGDVINTFPAVVNIKKHFNAEIHWLVAPLSAPLVANHAFVDQTILFDKRNIGKTLPAFLKKLRYEKYDMVLDFQRILKSGFFSMMSRTSRRIGFDRKRCKEFSWLFPFERIPPADPDSHMVNQYMEFAHHLNIQTDRVEWAIPRPEDIFFQPGPDYAVLNIGATKAANRWRPDNFARLARGLKTEFNLVSVLTGGREDSKNGSTIQNAAGFCVADFTGKTTIPQLVEIIAGASVVVSCDTGPMHLAAAMDKNLVALFGPSNPKRTGPYRGKVIQKDLPCVPCNRKKCTAPICMEGITPEDVLNNIRTWFTDTPE